MDPLPGGILENPPDAQWQRSAGGLTLEHENKKNS
jgi:hypothetical protein